MCSTKMLSIISKINSSGVKWLDLDFYYLKRLCQAKNNRTGKYATQNAKKTHAIIVYGHIYIIIMDISRSWNKK